MYAACWGPGPKNERQQRPEFEISCANFVIPTGGGAQRTSGEPALSELRVQTRERRTGICFAGSSWHPQVKPALAKPPFFSVPPCLRGKSGPDRFQNTALTPSLHLSSIPTTVYSISGET